MTAIAILAAIIWIAMTALTYTKVTSKWKNAKYEQIFFALLWPFVYFLWTIYYLHNKHW